MASLSLIAQRRVVGSSLVARRTIATSWRGSTFMYQASLPRLPIPPLDKVRQNFCCLLSRFFCGALNQTCLFKINPNRPLCSNKKNKQTNHSTTKLNCHTHTHTQQTVHRYLRMVEPVLTPAEFAITKVRFRCDLQSILKRFLFVFCKAFMFFCFFMFFVLFLFLF